MSTIKIFEVKLFRRFHPGRVWLVGLILAFLLLAPGQAYAQWPPFSLKVTPTHTDNTLHYALKFSQKTDGPMMDLAIKVPLPEGTRFLAAQASPEVSVEFDGAEVTFFSANPPQSLKNLSFLVEITDPGRTVFETRAWLAWKGAQPGDYLTEDITIDISRRPLNWSKPKPYLALESKARVTDQLMTYLITPKNVGPRRMWDVNINLPLPAGATIVSYQAPVPFTAGFDGQELSFKAPELAQEMILEPLKATIAFTDTTASTISAEIWANWTNVHQRLARPVEPASDSLRTALSFGPQAGLQLYFDPIGDAAFPSYDLTGITLQPDLTGLNVTFHTAGQALSADEPLEFLLYFDTDCQANTGSQRQGQGAEFRLKYRHDKGQAALYRWIDDQQAWRKHGLVAVNPAASGSLPGLWIPRQSLDLADPLCWVGRARYKSTDYYPTPPSDWLIVKGS